MTHTCLIDINNFGFAGMGNPVLKSGERDTQAIFSVMKRMNSIFTNYPQSNIICLDDGRSWRREIYAEYKANRTKTEKQEEARQSYFEQKEQIKKGLESLGIRQIWGLNYEADDMAYLLSSGLSKNGKVTLFTADCDWQMLVNENVEWVDLVHDKRCTHKNFQEVTGFVDPNQFIEAKCILGDAGDNIKGVNGIGPKTLDNIYELYESFHDILGHLDLDRDHAEKEWKLKFGKAMPKALREINVTETTEKLLNNYALVDLATEQRPPVSKLIDNKGKFDEGNFLAFCYENGFHSIIKNINKFIKPFANNPYTMKA